MFLFICSVFYAQVEYSSDANLKNAVDFYLDAAGYKSNVSNKTRMDFFIQVPYSSIQFVKVDEGFFGSYNVTLTFMDQSKSNILFERTWKEKIKAGEFAQTISKDNFNLSYKNYDLNPGKYFLKCIVEDADSKKASMREIILTVRATTDSLSLSDMMFISEIIKDPSGNKIIPNISASVTNKSKSFSFYFDVYSGKTQDVFLEYILEDSKRDSSFKQVEPKKLLAGVNSITHTLNSEKLRPGEYFVKIILKDGNMKEITSAEKKLFTKIYGIPSNITDLRKAVDQMVYIAAPEELNFIKDAKDNSILMERFLAFWDKRKPNKNTDDNPIQYEYYRRIDYSNRNFKGFSEGWRSDMGMVYVTFGPPSNVERHPFDSDSKPYEIWSYYELNRTFIFIDQTGFGEYRLYNADYSRWPGYR